MALNSHLVLIKVDEPKDREGEDGPFTQEEWVTNSSTGVVERISDNVTFCKVGDKVFFERYTSIPTPYGPLFKLCREDAIFEVL